MVYKMVNQVFHLQTSGEFATIRRVRLADKPLDGVWLGHEILPNNLIGRVVIGVGSEIRDRKR